MNKPKRILQIGAGNFGRGGLSTIVLNFNLNQNKEKIVFDYILENGISDEKYRKIIEEYNGKIYEIPNNKKGRLNRMKFYLKLAKFLRKSKYEIIHIHLSVVTLRTVIYQILGKFLGNSKIILHSHSTGIDMNKGNRDKVLIKHNILKRIQPLLADEFLACSRLAAEWLYPQKYLDKVKIVNNGIDIKKYQFDSKKRNELRQRINLKNKFVVGNIGRFSYQKNHEFLIKIFNEIQKIEKNSVLLLIGNGELEGKIKEQVKILGLQDKVFFLGVTDRVEDYLQVMDVFCFPTRFEGLSVVSIEAQAAALKVLISDNVSLEAKLTEYLEYFSLDKSPKEWAEKVLEYKKWYERKDVSELIKEKGYSIEYSAKVLEKIYLEI